MDPFEPASWWARATSIRRSRHLPSSMLCRLAARFLHEVRSGAGAATVFATHAAVVELARMDLEARLADANLQRRHRRACRECIDELLSCQRELATGRPGAAAHAVDSLVTLLVELDADPVHGEVDGLVEAAGILAVRRTQRAVARSASGRNAKSFDHLAVQQGQA
jgi:hypothetical protein